MARSSTSDILEKFRFGVSWGGNEGSQTIQVAGTNVDVNPADSVKAGFTDIQMPKRATNVVTYREGNNPDVFSKSAGLNTFEDIVCSRGLLRDFTARNEFLEWASLVHGGDSTDSTLSYNSRADGVSKTNSAGLEYRKDVTIWMYDRAGNVVRQWKLYNAWPANYVSGSDLSASEDGEKSLEQLTLTFEDFIEIKIASESKDIVTDETPKVG